MFYVLPMIADVYEELQQRFHVIEVNMMLH